MASPLTRAPKPELFIGLVGKIGVQKNSVINLIKKEAVAYGYETNIIKITSALSEEPFGYTKCTTSVDKKYNATIEYCNSLRKKYGNNEIMSLIAVAQIRQKRVEKTSDKYCALEETLWIIDQLKRPEEIELLRDIYGQNFIQMSLYARRKSRLDGIVSMISDNTGGADRDAYRSTAEKLMARDEAEEKIPWGQNVRDAFPEADVIINADPLKNAERGVERFFRAFFGDPTVSPTRDEYGAYLAASAALRSVDMSRQVGAVAMRASGEVATVGCNEVPKSGGGTYWEGSEEDDGRDIILGEDKNTKMKMRILIDAIEKMRPWLIRKVRKMSADDIIRESLYSESAPLKDAVLMDIIEFGRSVHAEMLAITDAARIGISLKNGTMYCTTFPCHNCAKHIVASGISRVVYIQPYPKSQVYDLYADSISVDPDRGGGGNVKFEAFTGIAPRSYRKIFEKGRRKEASGKRMEWIKGSSSPVFGEIAATYLEIEATAVRIFSDLLDEFS